MWIKSQIGVVETSRFAGKLAEAATAYRAAHGALDRLKASGPKNADWNVSMQARIDHIGAGIAEASGDFNKPTGWRRGGSLCSRPSQRPPTRTMIISLLECC